jgi:hypothetical protein
MLERVIRRSRICVQPPTYYEPLYSLFLVYLFERQYRVTRWSLIPQIWCIKIGIVYAMYVITCMQLLYVLYCYSVQQLYMLKLLQIQNVNFSPLIMKCVDICAFVLNHIKFKLDTNVAH